MLPTSSPRLASARAFVLAIGLLAVALTTGASSAQAATIAAGSDHFCAITDARQLACWGTNTYGTLGTGDQADRLRPALVADLSDVRSVAAAGSVTCASTGDGAAWCWGQLATGTTYVNQTRPVKLTGIADVAEITLAGNGQPCSLLRDRTVRCRVATEDVASSWTAMARATDVVEFDGLCARRADGTVSCMFDGSPNAPTDISLLRGASSIGHSDGNVCGVFADGSMRCSGEVPVFAGTGARRDATIRPVPGINDATALGSGAQTCVVRGGRVTCPNVSNSIHTRASPSGGPRVITGIDDAQALATTFDTACAVRKSGDIACWGSDAFEAGTGNTGFATTPVEVAGLSGVKAISAGRGHTCALRAGGRVACWGGIGYGTHGSRPVLTATDVAGVKDARSLSQGDYVACATTRQRALRCWGPTGSGALRYLKPATVATLPRGASPLRSIPGCFTVKRRARCLRLEDATKSKRASLVARQTRVGAFSGATSFASSSSAFDCAVLADATVSCRGTTWLVESSRGSSYTDPTPLTGISGVRSLSPGEVGSCAILVDNTVTCWGAFDVGDGTIRTPPFPADGPLPADGTRLPGFTDVRALAATGPNGPCAVLGSGGVVCTRPPVVRPRSGDRPTVPLGPFAMPGITDAVDIVAGYGHACVLRAAGTVACWGDGTGGAIGDGPAPAGHGPQVRPTPVADVKGLPSL